MNEKLNLDQERLNEFREYKLLLTTTGENLRKIGIKVLKAEFGYEIDPLDSGWEDAKIMTGEEVVLP